MPLLFSFQTDLTEAGCDEAGRGCLAGPVFAAAVVLNPRKKISGLNDSKQLSALKREMLEDEIKDKALAWAVATCSPAEIDQINILNASILAMHRALAQLNAPFELIAVDGNRFKPFGKVTHHTIVKGDAKYMNIAAASILAKTARDREMKALAEQFPQYGWERNMGYPTSEHRDAIRRFGSTPHHRMSFRLLPVQIQLF